MTKIYKKPRTCITLAIAIGLVIVAAASWTTAKSNVISLLPRTTAGSGTSVNDGAAPSGNWSKAILSVGNMSCGGCITNITASLAPLPGIGEVNVKVSEGTADIFFDPDKLKDPQQIAKTITAAGYPAKIEHLVAADKVRAKVRQMAQRATSHIASVGALEISRADYDMELTHARTRYQSLYGADVFSNTRGEQVLNQLKAQISSRLIGDAIKLQEVERAGHSITPEQVDQALDAYLSKRQTTLDAFKASLEASGYTFDYFKQKFSQRQRIQSYITEVVLNDSLDQDDRQARYANWLSNATGLAKVVYYDKALEALVQSSSSSGCGGSSCSVGAKKAT